MIMPRSHCSELRNHFPGLLDGEKVFGIFDGFAEGPRVGVLEGIFVGVREGFAVGVRVGLIVGFELGATATRMYNIL